jgi:hypothetical protein
LLKPMRKNFFFKIFFAIFFKFHLISRLWNDIWITQELFKFFKSYSLDYRISRWESSLVRRNDCEVSVHLRFLGFIFDNIKTNLNDLLEKKMPMTFDLWDINF